MTMAVVQCVSLGHTFQEEICQFDNIVCLNRPY